MTTVIVISLAFFAYCYVLLYKIVIVFSRRFFSRPTGNHKRLRASASRYSKTFPPKAWWACHHGMMLWHLLFQICPMEMQKELHTPFWSRWEEISTKQISGMTNQKRLWFWIAVGIRPTKKNTSPRSTIALSQAAVLLSTFGKELRNIAEFIEGNLSTGDKRVAGGKI